MCADKPLAETRRDTDEDLEKKRERLQRTKAGTRTMEGDEQIQIIFRIEKVKLHPKQTKSPSVSLKSTREDMKKELAACEQKHSQSGDINVVTQPEMSSQPDQLSVWLRKVTDYVESIATYSETKLQGKNDLLREIDNLKRKILAFGGRPEETQQSCRHETSTATNQRQQHHPGNTNYPLTTVSKAHPTAACC